MAYRTTSPWSYRAGPLAVGARQLLAWHQHAHVVFLVDVRGSIAMLWRVNLMLTSGCQGEYPVGPDGQMIACSLTDPSTTLAREIAGKQEATIVSTVLELVAK